MKKFLTLFFAIFFIFTAFAANPVADMLERIQPGASKNFVLQLKPSDTDYFELDQKGDKVVIRANSYVNMAVGLNWYLKYYANTHLSWNGMTASLPSPLPRVEKKERHETDIKLRYNFNYCTYSYTMPFWDWDRWEQEIDWMALHGVNLPLAAVGMECVWRNVLLRLGYTKDEVNDFISGPAFMAWWAMNNLEGWGGPNPDAWYERQEALQKKILARMDEWGIKPVFPGYSGMMPNNADEKLGLSLTKVPWPWCGFRRPAFLQPTDPRYSEIAAIYYDELTKLYGKADYYSMDPFHESGVSKEVDLDASGNAIMKAMKAVNPKAVWVVQRWSGNPRKDMIENLEQGDLLVLDLFAECIPMWGDSSQAPNENECVKHNWAFCMLENFGGNVGLHGRMDQLLDNYYTSIENPAAKSTMIGIGYTMEGSENNPVMFELMSELPWRAERFTKEEWIPGYIKARYGTSDDAVNEAWLILANSIYNCPRGSIQQGTHESIFCARPNMDNLQASSWSQMKNYYSPYSTLEAANLMASVADKYRGNNNFEYDLVDITRQALADQGRLTYQHTIADFKAFNDKGFKTNRDKFMSLINMQDKLLATRPEFKVGRWIKFAQDAADNDNDSQLYEWNARVQITTWGARENADGGMLRDYAHKEWNGLLRDFYVPRWQAFFSSLETELAGGPKAGPIDYYALEEPWTVARNPYSYTAEGNCVDAAKEAVALMNNKD